MAQNITLLGANYSAVPAVTLPKTGGGTATFTDVTDTTAAAADVASGKYFYTAAGVKTQGTASGGGGTDGDNLSYGTSGSLTNLKNTKWQLNYPVSLPAERTSWFIWVTTVQSGSIVGGINFILEPGNGAFILCNSRIIKIAGADGSSTGATADTFTFSDYRYTADDSGLITWLQANATRLG